MKTWEIIVIGLGMILGLMVLQNLLTIHEEHIESDYHYSLEGFCNHYNSTNVEDIMGWNYRMRNCIWIKDDIITKCSVDYIDGLYVWEEKCINEFVNSMNSEGEKL